MKQFLLFTILLFNQFIFSQQKQLKQIEEVGANYLAINELQIKLTENKIDIGTENETFYTELKKGKKIIKVSNSGSYFLIANFSFPSANSDFKINVNVFNKEGDLINKFDVTSSFDLPHPIFAINDDGIVSYFNPLKFEIYINDDGKQIKISLDKETKFEMERAYFIDMNNENIFVFTSITPLSIEENKSNTILFKINISDNSVSKKEFDYSSPSLLKLFDDEIILSGIKFKNNQAEEKTLKLDKNFDVFSEVNLSAEKIIKTNNGYFFKNGNKLTSVNNDFSVNKNFTFESNYFVKDIAFSKDEILALVGNGKSQMIYLFSSNLHIDFKESLDIFDAQNVNWFENGSQKFLIRTKDISYVFKIL